MVLMSIPSFLMNSIEEAAREDEGHKNPLSSLLSNHFF
jgi:hypothetical protein